MKLLERLLTALIAALFIAMILLVSLQVVNRYGLGLSIPWTEEAARTVYVMMIFIGSSLAVIRCNHVSVMSVVHRMPARMQRWIIAFGALCSAVFFGFVAYGNWLYTVVNWDAAYPTMSFLTIGHVIAVVMVSSLLTVGLFLYRVFRPCPPVETEVDPA